MAGPTSRFEPVGVLRGAATAIAICLPIALFANAVIDKGQQSNWSIPLLLATFLGFAAAGSVASRSAEATPLTTGALAALAGCVVIQTISVIVRSADGESVALGTIAFNALAAYGCGMTGAVLGERRRTAMSILVVDVGTSSVRSTVIGDDGRVRAATVRSCLPATPFAGLVELDAGAIATAVLDTAAESLASSGPVDAVGITNQRASTIVWDRASGEPVGPGLGWQDLRTIGECLVLQGQGIRLAPNASATKVANLLQLAGPGRDLCFGTVDTWVAWQLSGGALHVTDCSNAGLTGLLLLDGSGWDEEVYAALSIPLDVLPTIVDSTGVVGTASALPGAPPIAGIAGDQQASLIGQGCVRPGLAKVTFGTGGMLDVCVGADRPAFDTRGESGCFPVVAWQESGIRTWGVEAVMLSAGSCVEWLRDDLGLVDSAEQTHDVASSCADTEGVVFVPALLGLGAPHWDHGARGTLLGLTRGSGRPQIVRAVLEGVAQRGADLLIAAESDGGMTIERLRVDGGMSANPTFVQALADAVGRPVEVSPVVEATTLGAAYLAGLATGAWAGWDDIAAAWSPGAVVEPSRELDRARWAEAKEHAARWYPELSAIDF